MSERRWFVVIERHGIKAPAIYHGELPPWTAKAARGRGVVLSVELIGPPWQDATLERLWAEYQQREARKRWQPNGGSIPPPPIG